MSWMGKGCRLLTALWILLGVGFGLALAEDRAQPAQRWQQQDEGSTMKIDHRAWEAFLLNYLRPGEDGVHRLAYRKVSAEDRRSLAGYVDAMAAVDLAAYRRQEQLAYWINLYNALMVKLVLDHYPIASIRRIEERGVASKNGPWTRSLITIDGVSLSLNDIEKRILVPLSDDPRIYYAITCPAIGCPNLQPVPFSGDQLDRQLSAAARDYVNDPRCITIEGGKLHVSSLYRWNIDAFGGSERAVIQHLMGYANPDLAMQLQTFDRLHGDRFDWRLNDIAR